MLAVALNPAHIADGAAWGQVDSLLALLLAVCLYFASEGKWHWRCRYTRFRCFPSRRRCCSAPSGF